MSIEVGGINLADAIVNAEYKIGVLERLVNKLAHAAPEGVITNAIVEEFRQETLEELKRKYPNAGISTK
jgi:microcystin degradation protein MlrC